LWVEFEFKLSFPPVPENIHTEKIIPTTHSSGVFILPPSKKALSSPELARLALPILSAGYFHQNTMQITQSI
jgi:hypothetical protein